MPTHGFIANKAMVRAELEKRARGRRTITYGEAGRLIGRAPRGLSAIPTAIRSEGAEVAGPTSPPSWRQS